MSTKATPTALAGLTPSSKGKRLSGQHSKLTTSVQKFLVISLVVFMVGYFVFGALIWRTMHQPPDTIGRVMARMPAPVVFLLFPFETLWTRARAGALNVGDPAPDFSLLKVDKSGLVRLSILNKQQPVVLVFGSYT
jgi:hypothetical protein